MNAAAALKQARAAGVAIVPDGEDLMLTAPAPPPASVISALARHKSEALALLRPVMLVAFTGRMGFRHAPLVSPSRAARAAAALAANACSAQSVRSRKAARRYPHASTGAGCPARPW